MVEFIIEAVVAFRRMADIRLSMFAPLCMLAPMDSNVIYYKVVVLFAVAVIYESEERAHKLFSDRVRCHFIIRTAERLKSVLTLEYNDLLSLELSSIEYISFVYSTYAHT